MPERRPCAFIGSSVEGLSIAEAIQANLDHSCETVIWSQGLFGLGGGTLQSLVDRLNDFDFAILVLTPDDLVESREESKKAPRDNVLLELGMFIAALGPERTFGVCDRTAKMKLPSDLAGVTMADYAPPTKGNAQSAVGAACTKIKVEVERLGILEPAKVEAEVDHATQFQIIHDLLDVSVEQFLILMEEQGVVLTKGPNYGFGEEYTYSFDRTHHAGQGAFSINEACKKLPDAGLLKVDLRDKVTLTDRGRAFVAWLCERGHKADYFGSTVGGWGEVPADLPDFPPRYRPGVQPEAKKADPGEGSA